jgi:hypothetical protein
MYTNMYAYIYTYTLIFFYLKALNELLEDDDVFGFIIMDGNGCLYATLQGMGIDIYVYTYTDLYVYIYIYMCICIHIHIYI